MAVTSKQSERIRSFWLPFVISNRYMQKSWGIRGILTCLIGFAGSFDLDKVKLIKVKSHPRPLL